MNTTHGTPGFNSGKRPGSASQNSAEFSNLLREMWRTRPVRIPSSQGSDAWLGGIAEGIAVRYQISPVLVRLMFVALSLAGGVGLFTYLTLLLILPRYTVPLTPAEVVLKNVKDRRFEHEQLIGWLAGIFVVVSAIGMVNTLELAAVVALALVALVAWLLHSRTPVPEGNYFATAFSYDSTPPVSTDTPSPEAEENPYGSYGAKKRAGGVGQEEGEYTAAKGFEDNLVDGMPTPPSWDPLGAAPFAWHLPDPDELDEQRAQERARQEQAKRSKRKKGMGWFAGTVGVIVLVLTLSVVGGLIFASKDIIGGDSDSSSLNVFATTTQKPTADKGDMTIRYWLSNSDVDFSEYTAKNMLGETLNPQDVVAATGGDAPGAEQRTTIDLKVTMGQTTVTIPEQTDGAPFTVTTYCPVNIMTESDCEDGRTYQVRSTDPEAFEGAPEFAADLRISDTMATIEIAR